MRERASRWALLLAGLAAAVLAGELLLRGALPDTHRVWPPNLRRVMTPDPELLPGIRGESLISTNALGLRGPELGPAQRYRVLALGGSTTACAFLDDGETWTALLADALSRRGGLGEVWVGNAGKVGTKTANHRLQLAALLEQLPQLDALLLMIGLNDLAERLRFESDARYFAWVESPAYRQHLEASSFSVFPGADRAAPWIARTGWGRLWRRVQLARGGSREEALLLDAAGQAYEARREHRRRATELRSELPDLGPALRRFATNAGALVDAARARGVRPVLVTQAALWRADLSPDELDLLWLGRVGSVDPAGNPYYAAGALAGGLERYNEVLRGLCRAGRAECIDLAAQLPREAGVFTDDAHFSERGARLVAGILAEALLAAPPFSTGAQSDGRS